MRGGRNTPVCLAGSQNGGASVPTKQAPVILWYKNDLRTDDHPGLQTALASGRPVLAYFSFDSTVLADQSTMLWGPQVVRGAVLNLKDRLKALGVPLVIRSEGTAGALAQLATSTGSDLVLTEASCEQRWLDVMEEVEGLLGPGTPVQTWRTSAWRESDYVDNFRTFSKTRGPSLAPSDAPTAGQDVPPALSVEEGDAPSAADWAAAVAAAAAAPFDAAQARATEVHEVDSTFKGEKGAAYSELGDLMRGGEDAFRDMLAGYLRGAEGPNGSETWTRVQLLASKLEAIPGNRRGSFGTIFRGALALGIISRRRAYHEAIQYEAGRQGGRFLLFSTPWARSAAEASECADYHAQLAELLLPIPSQATGSKRCFWRWNGQLTDYHVSEPKGGMKEDTVTILLVHGFGACAEHWRRNLPDLAERGYRVVACSLPGFGPSEKMPYLYTTSTWATFIRDFVVNVVQTPVVVAGNSIGGVIPANAAADHPDLFRGVVLVNTAGSTEMVWQEEDVIVKKAPNRLVVAAASWATFTYLQRGISKQLEKLYPTRPHNADKWLNDEIYRASCDPCALQVLQSGFYLAPPRPLPHMLNTMYGGPVLVVQGVLDILNDAKGRAAKLESSIDRATAVCIDAGHCPHDEVPELVNAAIADFVEREIVQGSVAAVAA